VKKRTVAILIVILALSVAALWGYTVFDAGRTDSVPPVISLGAEELSVSVQEYRRELLADVTAWDDVDGDVTKSVTIESVFGITEDNRVTVVYAACDRAGNVSKLERQVVFSDYQSPRFTLNQALVFEFGTAFDVMAAVGAEDMLDGDILRKVKATMISNGLTVTEEGTHEVLFRVTNSLGDSVSLVLPVEVYPARRFDAELNLTDYILYVPQGGTFSDSDYLLSMQIPGIKIDLQNKIPESVQLFITGNVDTDTPGVYPVTYMAVYTGNAQTYTGYTKLLVVVEG
jgi:hypothetical protein